FTADAKRIVALGGGTITHDTDFVHVRSLIQADGALAWDSPGIDEPVLGDGQAALVAGGRVFAVGNTQEPYDLDSSGFLVQAHDATTGAVLWNDTAHYGQVSIAVSAAYARTTARTRVRTRTGLVPVRHVVAAAGSGLTAFGDRFGVMRAYDDRTGTLV